MEWRYDERPTTRTIKSQVQILSALGFLYSIQNNTKKDICFFFGVTSVI
jgi:hypothetical protein